MGREPHQLRALIKHVHARRLHTQLAHLSDADLPLRRAHYEGRILARCRMFGLEEFAKQVIDGIETGIEFQHTAGERAYSADDLVVTLVFALMQTARYDYDVDDLEIAYRVCCSLPYEIIENKAGADEAAEFLFNHIETLMLEVSEGRLRAKAYR